jgi:protein SCO1
MKRLCAIGLALALLAPRAVAAEERAAPLPPAVRDVDLEERLGGRVDPALGFTDMRGRPVRLGDYLSGGKPVLLVLAYYRCPMLCGLVLHGLVDGLKELSFTLGEEYRVLTVSFDPRDRPEAARAKRDSTLAGLGAPADTAEWPFLVGAEPQDRALADELGFRYAYDPATDQYAHPAAIFALTPDGRVSRYLYGVSFPPRDLRLALLEAGEGRIGTIVDRVLLTCYHYDPTSRRYGPYILGFLRLGAAVIMTAVALLVVLLFLGERKKSIPGSKERGRC